MPMAQFRDVFSTTLKVLAALLIISAALGLGFLFLGGVIGGLAPIAESHSATSTTESNDREDEADSIRTTMPKSLWDVGIARAVRKHCYTEGMSKEEVTQALGEPTKKTNYTSTSVGDNWTWQLPSGKCLRYDADQCAEQEKREKVIFFTPKGNVYLQGTPCQTINDEYVYFERSELFVKPAKRAINAPVPMEVKSDSGFDPCAGLHEKERKECDAIASQP